MPNLAHNKSLFNGKEFTKIKNIIQQHIENNCVGSLYYLDTPQEEHKIKNFTQQIYTELSYRLLFKRFSKEQQDYINLLIKERWQIYSRGPKGQKALNFLIQSDKVGWTLQEADFTNDYKKLGQFLDNCNDERIIQKTFEAALSQNFIGSLVYLIENKKYVPEFTKFEYFLNAMEDAVSVKLTQCMLANDIDIYQKNNLLLSLAIEHDKKLLQEFIINHFSDEKPFLDMVKKHKISKAKQKYALYYLHKKLLAEKLENNLDIPASAARMKI